MVRFWKEYKKSEKRGTFRNQDAEKLGRKLAFPLHVFFQFNKFHAFFQVLIFNPSGKNP